MSLEQLYKDAASGTYVGRVRTTQATDAPVTIGVNFMDGGRRAKYQAGVTEPADTFQTEFTRNTEGTYAVGGAQGTVPTTNNKEYTYSRWTAKALKLPFDGEGPPSLANGFYTTRFRTATTPRGFSTIHNYTPNQDKGYIDTNVWAKARYNASSTSPIGGGGGTSGGDSGGSGGGGGRGGGRSGV